MNVGNSLKNWKERYQYSPWLFVAGAVTNGFFVLLTLYIAVYGLVAFGMLARPYSAYLGIGMGIWAAAGGMMLQTFRHFPGDIWDNIIGGIVMALGSVIVMVTFGFYSGFWGECVWNPSIQSSTQAERCDNEYWLINMTWVVFLLVVIQGSAASVYSLIAAFLRREVKQRQTLD